MKNLHAVARFSLVLSVSSPLLTAVGADWPQWRGPHRDAHAAADEAPLRTLAPELKTRWRLSVGGGFSSPVVAGGRVVYMDEDGTDDVVHAVAAATGQEQWKAALGPRIEDEWGAGPRSTPILDGDRVYAQSCRGEFQCLKITSGELLWRTSFEKDFGVAFLGSKAKEGTAARRGNNGSAVIDGSNVIVPVGSTRGATLVCFDKLTGKIVWKAMNDEAAYSSPQVVTLAGVRQVVAYTADALAGLDPATGTVLWRVPLKTEAKRHAATPVIWDDFIVINSITLGQICFRAVSTEAGMKVEQAWANPATRINVSTHVKVGGFLYGQGPAKNFICVDATTGQVKWDQPGFGTQVTSTLAVGSTLLALVDDGQLVEIAADGAAYREQARIQACGKNWNFPALADGKLFVRDQRSLICLDLGSGVK